MHGEFALLSFQVWLAGTAQSKNLRSHPHMPPLAHTSPLKVTHLARHMLLSACRCGFRLLEGSYRCHCGRLPAVEEI